MVGHEPDGHEPDGHEPDGHEPDGHEPDGHEPETGPLRRCVVTRERREKAAMIRFVLGPDRRIVPDLAERLPGRGIWLSAERDVLERARTKGAFARAARGVVTVSPNLLCELVTGLQLRVGEHIGLARRAGQAVAGYAKTREWLEAGRAALLVQAADGSPAECRRLVGHRVVTVVTPLDAARLGTLFGREQTVHAALASGQLAERVRRESQRLAGLVSAGGDTRVVERDQASS